jgi:diguanylate cyclase (GGDEF)-like protein
MGRDRLRGTFAEVLQEQVASLLMLARAGRDDPDALLALRFELERVGETARYLDLPVVAEVGERALRVLDAGRPDEAVAMVADASRAVHGLEPVFRPVLVVGPDAEAVVSRASRDFAAVLRAAPDVAAALAAAAEEEPSAVVVDHRLVEAWVEGMDVSLRAVPFFAVGPVDAVRARVTCRDLGAVAWFSEPVSIEAVLGRVRACGTEADPPPLRVLVADGEGSRYGMVVASLEGEDLLIRRARTPQELAQMLESFAPELVISASQLGGLTGAEVGQLVRGHEWLADTPLVLLVDDAGLEHTGLSAAADDVVTFPYAARPFRARIAARVRRARLSRRQREIDVLTHLLGRGAVLSAADREVRLSRRNASILTVVMVDVDEMRRFNRDQGVEQGDRVLRQVAELLRSSLRETDIVGRIGGDAFAVLMPGCQVADAAKRLEAVLAKARERFEVLELRGVGLSIGIADTRRGHSDVLARADAALLQARRTGGDRLVTAST